MDACVVREFYCCTKQMLIVLLMIVWLVFFICDLLV
jgi:hypothetical protein